MTLVRSPRGIVFTEGKRDWDLLGNLLDRIITDIIVGYEMGFAEATADPWAPRGARLRARDILMSEV